EARDDGVERAVERDPAEPRAVGEERELPLVGADDARGRDADEPDRAGRPLALPERQRGVRERRSVVRRSGKRRAAREEPELAGPEPLGELQLEDDDSGAYPVGTETARDGVGVRDDRGAHGRIV